MKVFFLYALVPLSLLLTFLHSIRIHALKKNSEHLYKLESEKAQQLRALNEEMAAQNEEIMAQNEEITLQYEILVEIRRSLEETVEKRTASLREINAALALQNSHLEQYAFITAHNLRGPVARIKGLVNLIPVQSIELDYLKMEAKNLDELLAELNEILEVQLNTDTNKFEQVHVNEVVTKVVLSFKDQIEKIDAVIDTSSFEELTVPGFKSYFNSIFYNLLSNALKYSDPARKQAITISCVKINGNTHITVKDTGIGIDMRYAKDKIFTMYQHFHPEINGKGFGLFLVRSQIEAMNGRITVESEVGQGTTFNIVFKNNGHH